ncbi:MAG: tyrosine-type recombinase/integrase [Planctomycetia bacterium]|nr:tyrosine-type recombinase/integrase [Planctomycetia bacterium]
MSRRKNDVPTYGLHKPSGQARIVVDGQSIYLGKHGSPESLQAYSRWVTKLAAAPAAGRASKAKLLAEPADDLTINELIVRYLHFADGYYRIDGKRTSEYKSMVEAAGPLRRLYGLSPAREFGPKALKQVQEAYVQHGLCRKSVNKHVFRVRRIFRWAVAEELVHESLAHGLAAVESLRRGKTAAPETLPTATVDLADVEAVIPFVSDEIAAMIRLQYHAAMRPAEVTIMRLCDIDRSDPELWLYRPTSHKTAYRDGDREIYLGEECRKVLGPFMDRPADAFLFSPAIAERRRNEKRNEDRDPNRKTKIFDCELRHRVRRREAAARRQSMRPKRDHYDADSYRRAVAYGIRQARKHGIEVQEWSPRRLRHTMATKVREKWGVEGAQIYLGHSKCSVTQVYAQRDRKLGREVALDVG